jgi:hypothetical protein
MCALDKEGDGHSMSARSFHESFGGHGCGAGGDDIVHDQNAVSGLEGIRMDFQSMLTLVGGEAFPEGRRGELARLPGWHKAQSHLLGQGAAKDEAAGLQPQHMRWLKGENGRGHGINGQSEGLGIRQQRADIPESDGWGRETWHFSDKRSEVHGTSLASHLKGKGKRLCPIQGYPVQSCDVGKVRTLFQLFAKVIQQKRIPRDFANHSAVVFVPHPSPKAKILSTFQDKVPETYTLDSTMNLECDQHVKSMRKGMFSVQIFVEGAFE